MDAHRLSLRERGSSSPDYCDQRDPHEKVSDRVTGMSTIEFEKLVLKQIAMVIAVQKAAEPREFSATRILFVD
jgi:hypothetical protein